MTLATTAAGLVGAAAALASCWILHEDPGPGPVPVHAHAVTGDPAVALGAVAGVAAAGLGAVAVLGLATRRQTRNALEHQRAEHVRFLMGVASELRHPLSTVAMSLEALRPDSGVADGERLEIAAIVGRQMQRLDRLADELMERVRADVAPVRTK